MDWQQTWSDYQINLLTSSLATQTPSLIEFDGVGLKIRFVLLGIGY